MSVDVNVVGHPSVSSMFGTKRAPAAELGVGKLERAVLRFPGFFRIILLRTALVFQGPLRPSRLLRHLVLKERLGRRPSPRREPWLWLSQPPAKVLEAAELEGGGESGEGHLLLLASRLGLGRLEGTVEAEE